jgi:protein phosphatase 2C family protein 2/3
VDAEAEVEGEKSWNDFELVLDDERESDGEREELLSASPTASLGSQAPQSLQGKAPPPPKLTTSVPIKQAKSTPDGDAPSGALKVEGFMDSSESPMKM